MLFHVLDNTGQRCYTMRADARQASVQSAIDVLYRHSEPIDSNMYCLIDPRALLKLLHRKRNVFSLYRLLAYMVEHGYSVVKIGGV